MLTIVLCFMLLSSHEGAVSISLGYSPCCADELVTIISEYIGEYPNLGYTFSLEQ